MSTDNITDVSWIRQAFMVGSVTLDKADKVRRVYSSSSTKYTDTTLGGNFAINSPPQFTRFADLKMNTANGGSAAYRGGSKGMGRYYSEAIDDNAIHVHMRFGVAEYNSLTTFMSGFLDSGATVLARTGETPGIFFNIGKLAGFLVSAPLVPFVLLGQAYNFFAGKPYSKYYYLKPTMALYWNAVNTLVNTMAVNMGLIAAGDIAGYDTNGTDKDGNPKVKSIPGPALNANDIAQFNALLPDIFRKSGGIDIYAVANRAQRIKNREVLLQITDLQNAADAPSFADKAQEILNIGNQKPPPTPSLEGYVKKYKATKMAVGTGSKDDKQEPVGTWEEGFTSFLSAELADGSQWITLKVNNESTVTESFSNSVKESDIAGKINGMSSSSRETRFSTMEGNIGDGLLLGGLEGIIGAVKDIATGVADGVGMSGLAALGGSAFVDIPKHWDQSTADLPKVSYKLELRAPYGNKMSIFTNLYVPLAMILAATLPLSTGKQSYTSPFLVEAYSKGRTQTRGLIDSLSITRGVGNVGWSDDELPLGLDITFSIVDTTSVMHMALDDTWNPFDDDSAFTDYMAVLGSLGIVDQTYNVRKFKRNMSKIFQKFEKYRSPAFYASQVAGTLPGRILRSVAKATARN